MKCKGCEQERLYMIEGLCLLCNKAQRNASMGLGNWIDNVRVKRRGLEIKTVTKK